MTPVLQTKFYEPELPPEEQRGNCLQAVLASLLDLPLESVPHFVQDHVDHNGDQDGEWNWWTRMIRWLRTRGYTIEFTNLEDDRYLAVAGPSPRGMGIHHIVIYKDGKMVHDPHPDSTGILEEQTIWTLVSL